MNKRTLLSLAVLVGSALALNAQTFQEGFYLREYARAYQYNPAIIGHHFIGAVQYNSTSHNNVGASSFLYPTADGGLISAFNSAISADTFLGSLPEYSRMRSDIHASLVSYGFFAGGAFHTVDLNVRGGYGVSVPKELFAFVKLGMETGSRNFSNLNLDASIMAELAYGYARQVTPWLSVGARAKLLLPIMGGRYNITRMNMTINAEQVALDYRGEMYLTNRLTQIGTNEEGYLDLRNLSQKLDLDWLPSGAGLAVDLGLVFTPAEGLTISASVLDLGGVYWFFGNRAMSSGVATFEGLDNVTMAQLNKTALKDMALDVGNKFLQVLRPVASQDKWQWESLPLQANLGVKYELPFWRKLTVGATGRYLNSLGLPYWDARLGLEVNPWKWLDVTANFGTGARGLVFGAAVEFKFHHFRLCGGVQNGFGGTVPDSGTPLKPNFSVFTVGITYDL